MNEHQVQPGELEKTEPEQEHTPGSGCQSAANCSKSCQSFGKDERVDRAEFMQTALGTVAVVWGGIAFYPIYMYLNPKPGEKSDDSKVTSLEVCKIADLPKGTGRNFRFGSTPALVIHTEDGQVHAFKAVCTHLGCTVQYRESSKSIYCACHGGEYNADTGKNIAGPPPKPLAPLKAEVVDGKVIVSRA